MGQIRQTLKNPLPAGDLPFFTKILAQLFPDFMQLLPKEIFLLLLFDLFFDRLLNAQGGGRPVKFTVESMEQ